MAYTEKRIVEFPVLAVEFDDGSRYGYWDGGRKKGGTFAIESYRPHPGPGHYLRWGCFRLNFWFTAGSGVSWEAAAEYAVRRLRNLLNVPATITLEWEEKSIRVYVGESKEV